MRFTPITQQQFLVRVEQLSAYFETFSGLEDTAEVATYTDGFSRDMREIVGPRKIQPVTLTKPFVPEDDIEIVTFWKNFVTGRALTAQSGTEITIQPVNYSPEPEAIGSPYILYGAVPSSINFLTADKKSQEVAVLSLTFSIQQWAIG